MASKRLEHRELSLLVGILSGIILSIFASATPITSFGLIDFVTFLAIPTLAGALVEYADAGHPTGNGVLVGMVVGLVYVILSAVKVSTVIPTNIVLFLVLTVPIWGFLGGLGSMFIRRSMVSSRYLLPTAKLCSACRASNPPDALFCKNCGTKLS